MNRARNIYFGLFALALVLALYTILKVTPLNIILLSNATKLSFFQRLFGLWGYTFLFFQILLGSDMIPKAQKFGSWVHKTHITFGVFAYTFVFFHPLTQFLIMLEGTKVFNPFYVYTDFCILCKTNTELILTLGRVAFWVITATFISARLRTHPIFRRVWRTTHVLNYLAFLFVGIHAFLIGNDVQTHPFFAFYIISMGVFLLITTRRIINFIRTNFQLKQLPHQFEQ